MSRSKYFGIWSKLVTLSISTQYCEKKTELGSMNGHICSRLEQHLDIVQKLPLPVTEAKQRQTSLWFVSDHLAGFSSPLQSGPVPCTKTPLILATANLLKAEKGEKVQTHPLSCASADWRVAFTSLTNGAQHDLNQSRLLAVSQG